MSAKFRTEKDSLGTLQVPADAYYGVQAARAVANFPISGMRAHPALILAYVQIKRAAAVTNLKLGMLDKPRADAIIKAADLVLADAAKLLKRDPQAVDRSGNLLDQWVIDVYQAGAGTSFNMNTNEVLANLANEKYARKAADKARGSYSFVHPNDHVNMAQSTNDTMPTGIRISNLMILPDTLAALDLLEGELRKKGREFEHVITTGRTHLQDATPITLGQVFTGFADCLKKARVRVHEAGKKLSVIGLGGTAVGTGMNSHPDYAKEVANQIGLQLSQRIGLRITTAPNKVEMHNSLADQLEFSAALRSLAVDLGRIANDLRLLSSGPTSGIGEINLPPVQPGSSIMPGKVNPVMLEMFNMVCYNVIGLDSAVCGCAQAGQYQLNVMMPIVAWDLLHMQTILTTSMTVVAERCIRGITANEEVCRKYFEASMGLATVLNPLIGYSAAAEIVKHAVKSGTPIMDEVRAAKKADGSPLLTEAQIQKAFEPGKLTQPGFLKLDGDKPKATRKPEAKKPAAKTSEARAGSTKKK
ncbi:MAG: aspartate ammonia-lyase [Planctomycetales bacterium]|nr:aspartate ammonia-lyase [bacterium]UNM08955.1 MAG: aspartate ammonia-lyase [Planctomycetales bacterium]